LRARDNVELIQKTHENNIMKKKIEKDKLDAQHAKLNIELNMNFNIADQQRVSLMLKYLYIYKYVNICMSILIYINLLILEQ
jgi:hypothetical protein